MTTNYISIKNDMTIRQAMSELVKQAGENDNISTPVSYTHLCPTSNNHVLMLRATDENGNVLPEFEKVLDIDIKAAAEAALGRCV